MGYANSDLVVAAAQPLSPPLPWQGKGGEAAGRRGGQGSESHEWRHSWLSLPCRHFPSSAHLMPRGGEGQPCNAIGRSLHGGLPPPQPSLAPMKAGVASPLPSPSPSLADANSGKVGRRDLRPGRHQTHAEHKGRGDEAEAGRADVVAAAADPRRRRSTSRSPSASNMRIDPEHREER